MFNAHSVAVIIPALNEETSLPRVLKAIPDWVDRVVVVDNGSTDATADVAASAGAHVVSTPQRGYGRACLAGIAAACDDHDILVFLDGDYSDFPEQMDRLVSPIADGEADLVIGSRTRGQRARGALTPVQRFGNALSCRLIRWFWGHAFTDLGPFRAIRTDALAVLRMDDQTYGWTIQMQIRALRAGLRVREVPVDYRCRIGRSKISGTLTGAARAGSKILQTIRAERRRPAPVLKITPRSLHLIVFTRAPEPGRAKTRLIPALGAEGAAELHNRMTLHTLAMTDRLRSKVDASIEIRFAGGSTVNLAREFGRDRVYLRQPRGDLGVRIHSAIKEAILRGASSVVVIGSDCPGLSPELLLTAFAALKECDLVLGPARDGGYYLIGLRASSSSRRGDHRHNENRRPCNPIDLHRTYPALFEKIDWGTASVTDQTLARASEIGLKPFLLPVLDDVDEPADLPVWNAHCERYLRQGRVPRLSVIIPALNEEAFIGSAIDNATGEDIEVIVADGGSTDRTVGIAGQRGAVVVRSFAGRARQMNAGARSARGAVLLFLHADTCLPTGYDKEILGLLDDPGVMLAAFRLGIDHPRPALRFIERLANLRSCLLGLPYGDQALAIRACDFHRLGGYPILPIMEDFDFVRLARRLGRVRIARSAVRTSARRWLETGILKLTLINQACILGHRLGITPARIAAWRNGAADKRGIDLHKSELVVDGASLCRQRKDARTTKAIQINATKETASSGERAETPSGG